MDIQQSEILAMVLQYEQCIFKYSTLWLWTFLEQLTLPKP